MVFDDLIDRLIIREEGKSIFMSALISTLTYILLTNHEMKIQQFNFLHKLLIFMGMPFNGGGTALLETGVRGVDLVLEIIISAVLSFFIVLIAFTLFSHMISWATKAKHKLM